MGPAWGSRGSSQRSLYPQAPQVHSGFWGPNDTVSQRAGAGAGLAWASAGREQGHPGWGQRGAAPSKPRSLPGFSFLLCDVQITTAWMS